MRGNWGTIWLAALIITVSVMGAPLAVKAADAWEKSGMPVAQLGSQSPMEAQMLGEKPFQARPAPTTSGAALLSDKLPGFRLGQDGGAALKLPFNLEMQISVRYNREPAALEPQKRSDSLLMNSSLDYRLLPNFKVGLNAYLYRPDPGDKLSSLRPFDDRVMGLGPGIKYDLGRWSFLLKSQVETGSRERGSDLQNTLRVWYAF
jgi:hypothetical protein